MFFFLTVTGVETEQKVFCSTQARMIKMNEIGGSTSNLLKLLGDNKRVRSCNFLSPNFLKIENTVMFLRIPVDPTKHGPTPAPKPRQPHPLFTYQTPVRFSTLLDRTIR